MKNRYEINQKSTKNRSKIDQKSKKIDAWRGSGQTLAPKRVLGGVWVDVYAILAPTWGQLGTQHGAKLEPKSFKNRCQNRSKNWSLLRSIFGRILEDLGRQNGAKLVPKWHPKWSLSWKRWKSKKHLKTNEKSMILEVPGVPKSIKNRSKIDYKSKPKLGCLLASIFRRFWEVLGAKLGRKTEPRSIKNRNKKASKKLWKKECVLEASWRAKPPQHKPGVSKGTGSALRWNACRYERDLGQQRGCGGRKRSEEWHHRENGGRRPSKE